MRLPYNRQCRSVFLSAQFFQLVENRAKDVSFIIRGRSGKIGEIFGALYDCNGALEAHSGIDVALRQSRERSIRVCIELDEHQVPNFDATRIVLVHKRASRIAVWCE